MLSRNSQGAAPQLKWFGKLKVNEQNIEETKLCGFLEDRTMSPSPNTRIIITSNDERFHPVTLGLEEGKEGQRMCASKVRVSQRLQAKTVLDIQKWSHRDTFKT